MSQYDGQLVSLSEVKAYLNLSHSQHDELIGQMILEAESRFQSYTGRLLQGIEHTELHDGGGTRLFLRHHPVTNVSITDTHGTLNIADDTVVDTDLYRVRSEEGIIIRTNTVGRVCRWEAGIGRWQVTYTGGLDQGSNWERFEAYSIRATFRDLVTEWYTHRRPSAEVSAFGGGVSTTYFKKDVPPRVLVEWDQFTEPIDKF